MKYTVNLNLKKPDLTDSATVEDLNYNFDTLDKVINELSVKINSNSTELNGQRAKAITLHNKLDKIF